MGDVETMKSGEIKNAVDMSLKESMAARNNDLKMYAIALKKLGLPTDIEQLAEMFNTNILESMRRQRQTTQAINPFLGPTERTAIHRRLKEKEMRKNARTI